MKNLSAKIGLFLCCFGSAEIATAGLNEWNFERDAAGLTLAQAENSGTEQAVFAAGGEGVLETDGNGNLLSTHTGVETNSMWSSGTILNADVTDVSSGVHYVRYDCAYTLTSSNYTDGLILGLSVIDGSGTNIAGIALEREGETEVPAGRKVTPVVTQLSVGGRISAILRVDMDAKTLMAWYDLTGSNLFDEQSPAVSNIPITLTSVDKLQFQATGDIRPSGSADTVAVDNLRTAATWEEIVLPVSVPLTVHPLFRNNMVLQRDMDVPVWGHATPGSVVSVKMDGVVVGTTVADPTGRWSVKLGAHAGDAGQPHILLISSNGETDIQITDVVYGDVYIATGQSNMAYYMGDITITGYAEEQAAADSYPLIRWIEVSKKITDVELEEPVLRTSSWVKCNTNSIADCTATGYFFAKNVYLKTGVPVGLLVSAWGGKRIEPFLSRSGVEAIPELAGMRQYEEQGGITNLYEIYNARVAPLAPYGVRGAILYQGEANDDDGDIYRCDMQALIRGWRKKWGQGNFSFYYVQLPNYNTTADWPGLRNSQLRALSETNTGMAVTIDIGDNGNLHPANKPDVGARLARWTLAKDMHYDIAYSGPLYRSSLIEGSQIRIIFDYAENGLMTAWKTNTNPVVSVSGPLQNFEIAGSNKVFFAATALIDRDSVVVSSPSVPAPVYVRYCYASAPAGTNKLYNADGLPASPFRTDESYRLDVISGSATGTNIVPGAQAIITAAAPAVGKMFDRWIGTASAIDNLNASTATVTMPAHSLYLLAAYRDSAAPVYTLTVNNGFGDGTSQAGSILNLEANAPVTGQQFDHWSGDTQTVVNVFSSSTTLRMPSNSVTVTAVYRTADSVGDGISDAWRASYFGGDGTAATGESAVDADPDKDGASNLQEYIAGTSPVDALSVLRLGDIISGKDMTLSFSSVAGRRYRLEATDSLTAPQWETVLYNIVGDGKRKQNQCNLGVSSNGFYRLSLIAE